MTGQLTIPVEFRAGEADSASPGRLIGTIIRYDQQAVSLQERFSPGALSWAPGGIILNAHHERSMPIIRFEPLEQSGAVVIDVNLPDTQISRDAMTSVRNGTLRGLSVEFQSLVEKRVDGIRVITSARLLAAALVDDPAYSGQLEVRAEATTRRVRWL